MARISEMITETIESWVMRFRERLKGWAVAVISLGIETFMDLLGSGLAKQEAELIDSMLAAEDLPDDMRLLLERAKEGGGEWQALLLGSLGGAAVSGAVSQAMFPPLEKMKQHFAKKVPYQLMPMINLIALKFRGLVDDEYFREHLRRYGYADVEIENLVKSFMFYPIPQDLVLWLAREVFEEDMVERYGLDDEAPLDKADLFLKAGVSEEQMINYWRAHWEHASFGQVVEMLHRGVLSVDKTMPEPPDTKAGWESRDQEGKKAMFEWFRVVEIPPYWRDRLTAMSWNVPTRVDVRRWWDMRTIDEQELYNIYHRQGYHGKDLDNYVLWTKVYTAFPDLLARWQNGWITLDDVKTELTNLGMPADRVQEILETKIQPTEPGRVSGERDLTKTDIIKGVKTEQITRTEGIELLVDIGYDDDEADYILAINIPVDEVVSVVKEREITKSDIYAGLQAGILTDDEALVRLAGLRYSSADAQLILAIFRSRLEPPVETRDKEASKADVILAVKGGLITPEDGYLMLQDIGYSPEAAQFILAVRAETSPFSPVNYNEFKDLTQKYRRAAKREVKPMSEELKQAAEALVQATKEVERLRQAVANEAAKFADIEIIPEEQGKPLTKLRVALHRAEAELARIQADYDRLAAAFKYSPEG